MKRILITGGSSGIGKEIALEMAKDGNAFYLMARDEKKLKAAEKELESLGSKVCSFAGDTGNEDNVEAAYRDAKEKMGGIDVLVANAGVGYFGYLEEMKISEFDEQFHTNVRGVFLWLKKVLPEMKERNSGQIIVTSSNLGLKTSPRASIYSATKHAVQAMIWSLRDEVKGTGVKAATINPGSVSTPWFDGRDVDRSKMLTARDVAKATRLIIEQEESSNIDHILIMPGK